MTTAGQPYRRRVGDQVFTSQEEWNAARSARSRELRERKTPEERASENERRRSQRLTWSPERLEASRAQDRRRYASRSPEERAQRTASRRPLTEEQRLAKNQRSRQRDASMNEEWRERRRAQGREQMQRRRASWTPEERELAYAEHAERERKRRAAMSDEERAMMTLRDSARKFGFDPNEIEAHFRSHNGRCDICGRTPAEVGGKSKSRLSIDHDHLTGAFRGLLCPHCNYALGQMGDSPERLIAAAEYLLKSQPSRRAALW